MCVHPDPAGMAGAGFARAKRDVRRRLLVINSDRAFLRLAGEIGETLGFQVRSSTRAGDFTRLYEDFAPSVILFDFFSARMDGIELVNWLRERESDAHLLLTSAQESFLLGFARELARARGYRKLDLMVEPTSRQELSEVLSQRLMTIALTEMNPEGAVDQEGPRRA